MAKRVAFHWLDEVCYDSKALKRGLPSERLRIGVRVPPFGHHQNLH